VNRREIEDIEEDSQAEILGLRPAIWLTHIQGELIAGKPDSVRKTTPLCSRFYTQNDHITKTGSGHT